MNEKNIYSDQAPIDLTREVGQEDAQSGGEGLDTNDMPGSGEAAQSGDLESPMVATAEDAQSDEDAKPGQDEEAGLGKQQVEDDSRQIEGEEDMGDEEEEQYIPVVPKEEVVELVESNSDLALDRIVDVDEPVDRKTFDVITEVVETSKNPDLISERVIDKICDKMVSNTVDQIDQLSIDEAQNITIIEFLKLIFMDPETDIPPAYNTFDKNQKNLFLYDYSMLMPTGTILEIFEKMRLAVPRIKILSKASTYKIQFEEGSKEDRSVESCMSLRNRILSGMLYPRIRVKIEDLGDKENSIGQPMPLGQSQEGDFEDKLAA